MFLTGLQSARCLPRHPAPPATLRQGEVSTSGRKLSCRPCLLPLPPRQTRICCEPESVVVNVEAKEEVELAVAGDFVEISGKSLKVPEKYEGLPLKEVLRRMRISYSNKGKTVWNKGKMWSPDARELIRQRVIIAMKRPEVRQKCKEHAKFRPKHTEEEKAKISVSVKKSIIKRRYAAVVRFFLGEISTPPRKRIQPKKKRVKKVKERARMKRTQRFPRPQSEEQKLRIAESIRLKWLDPEYREKQAISTRKNYTANPQSRWSASSLDKSRPGIREAAYLKVMGFIKKLITSIRELEHQKEVMFDNHESTAQIEASLQKAKAVLVNEIVQAGPAHRDMGERLGVDLNFEKLVKEFGPKIHGE